MATRIYTFDGITNPSTTHKAWHMPDDLYSPPSFGGASEASSTNYGQLAEMTSPETPWTTYGSQYRLDYQAYRFKLDEAPANITQLNWYVALWQPNVEYPQIQLCAWNFDTEAWDLVESQIGGEYTALHGPITTNIGNYVDANGYAYAYASATDTDQVSELRVDFIKLTVTTTETFVPIVAVF